jgi:hypothetical protein
MGSSAISNQLEVGSIMVRAIKSICELSLPLRVYGPMRSTHKHSQGFVMTVFGEGVHNFVTVSYYSGKICKTLLVTGWWYAYLFSTLQYSSSL